MEATSVKEQFAGFRHGGKVHFRRFTIQLPISVKAENGRIWHHGRSSNVSTRGIYFDFPESVEVGCRFEILLTIPGAVTKGEPILVRLFATAVRVDRPFARDGPVGIATAIERFDFGEEDPAQPEICEQELPQEEQPAVEEQLAAQEEQPTVHEHPTVQRKQSTVQQEQHRLRRFRVDLRDPAADPQKVDQLFAAFLHAKRTSGENTDNMSSDTFRRFVHKKTAQLKRDFGCQQVEYVIEVNRGQVKLKAKVV